MDPRYQTLADLLISYSCALEEGESVLVEAIDVPPAFVRALVRRAAAAGARPFVQLRSQAVWRDLLLAADAEQLSTLAACDAALMREMDAYVGVRGSLNVSEWSDLPPEQVALYETHYWKPVHQDVRVAQTRWVVLRWPTPSMAQLAQMSTEAFEDFYFRVCTLDYARMAEAMRPLVELMEATDRVRLVAPDAGNQGTDLRFSIRGIPAIPCDGKLNIPDGEVFTAPVIDSVEGTIAFNTPTIYQGVTHENVRLSLEHGRIVEATSSNSEHLLRVLDTDVGARAIGEFAIGFNPLITRPMKDILFDEKIAGSIHFTPGQAYEEADNGNRSKIHWDLVLRMDEASGGGEIWFDDRLIRKDGRFVVEELEGLNPENLA
ncbi:MAG TPA: aminopeptidase [Thermoanaerobaculia bacterium]|nr:aminopeptidase [Thermoanaerobaculia bacterium]